MLKKRTSSFGIAGSERPDELDSKKDRDEECLVIKRIILSASRTEHENI